jgi:hypothetical protein
MSDVPQTVETALFPDTDGDIQNQSIRVPRKIVDEDNGGFEFAASTEIAPINAPPYSASGPSLANSLPILNGISFPPNMDPNDILSSDRAISLLQQLEPQQIQAAVNEFAEAMNNKGERVRNVQAYFVGVIKRYVTSSHGPAGSRSDRDTKGTIMGAELSPTVKVRSIPRVLRF